MAICENHCKDLFEECRKAALKSHYGKDVKLSYFTNYHSKVKVKQALMRSKPSAPITISAHTWNRDNEEAQLPLSTRKGSPGSPRSDTQRSPSELTAKYSGHRWEIS